MLTAHVFVAIRSNLSNNRTHNIPSELLLSDTVDNPVYDWERLFPGPSILRTAELGAVATSALSLL